jgi:hypothetical protein
MSEQACYFCSKPGAEYKCQPCGQVWACSRAHLRYRVFNKLSSPFQGPSSQLISQCQLVARPLPRPISGTGASRVARSGSVPGPRFDRLLDRFQGSYNVPVPKHLATARSGPVQGHLFQVKEDKCATRSKPGHI